MISNITKRIIVILGMHRSGTSAITRAVVAAGAEVGNNLLPAGQDNPTGFWEDKDFVTFNDRLLALLGGSYDSLALLPDGFEQRDEVVKLQLEAVVMLRNKLQGVQLFAIKDPRTCRLLPFWQGVFEHLQVRVDYVIAVRNPLSVGQSLLRRDGFPERKSYWLWLQHYIAAVRGTQGEHRLFIDYDRLMSNPERELERLTEALELVGDRNALKEYVETFLSDELRHASYEAKDLDISPLVPALVRRAYGLLSQVCADGSVQASATFLDAWHELDAQLLEWQHMLDFVHEYDLLSKGLLEHKGLLEQEARRLALLVDQHEVSLVQAEAERQRLEHQLSEQTDRLALAVASNRQQADELHLRNDELAQVTQRLYDIFHSRSMRMTRPLRWASEAAQTLCRGAGCAARHVFSNPRNVSRALAHIRVHGLRSGLRRMREVTSPDAMPVGSMRTHARFDLKKAGEAVVLTTPHCLFVAELIARQLSRAGIKSQIVFEKPAQGFARVPHFVICPQMFPELPERYVAFQMEQTVSSRWLTESYMGKLEHAFAVFDYSQVNIGHFTTNGLSYRQMYFMPIGYLADYAAEYSGLGAEKEYDVIFYGDANNERRQRFIARIGQTCRVKVISNLFGEALYAELRKARVLVNIHYYEGALLETTRIYEALSLDCLIVSESSVDIGEHEGLRDIVDFVDIGDAEAMVARLEYWLADDQRREQKVEHNRQLLERQPNWFEYFFQRYLLATDNIDFDTFYQLAGDNIRFKGDFLCLGLPESVERRASFDTDNHYGIEYFPGLRHELGWVGCGMSYKFIMRKAREQQLPHISVCEDDVQFLDGWQDKYRVVLNHLEQNAGSWDVFSGFIADLHADTRVLGLTEIDGLEIVHIDHMVSAVLNVYNEGFYDAIMRWDETNHDVHANAIDRYMEGQEHVRVLTVHPFLVGHKEEQHSTLWGFQNSQYNALIEQSTRKLEDKIEGYRKTKEASADA